MQNFEASAPPRRPRRPRRRNKNESRAALLRAAFDLLASGQAVTTVAVTRKAGLSQSAFYVHFKDAEECALEAVREAVRVIFEHVSERQRFQPGDPEAIERHVHGVLSDDAIGDTHRVFDRCLYDPGPVGELVRQYFSAVRVGLIEELWKIATLSGVDAKHYSEFVLQAELIFVTIRAARAAVREGRCRSIDEAARVLTRNYIACIERAIEACGGRLPPAARDEA
jgi:TetR/AcrR family transcriptional regulator, fatty acid biosynthesis regulator